MNARGRFAFVLAHFCAKIWPYHHQALCALKRCVITDVNFSLGSNQEIQRTNSEQQEEIVSVELRQ